MYVRFLGRFKQMKALRTHLSRRWANPDIGRPEAVVKYLINLQQERHQDKFETADQDDVANANFNLNNSNRNWNRRRRMRSSGKSTNRNDDSSSDADDADVELGMRRRRQPSGYPRNTKPAWLALVPRKRSSEFNDDESEVDSETSLLSGGEENYSRSSSSLSIEGIDSDYVYSSTDSELNLAF